MNQTEKPDQPAEGDRLSRMSQASIRINESLDFETVLQDVVDSARSLTESRYGALTVLDETGLRPHFIVSGLTQEEHQGLWEMPQGLGFYEYLAGLKSPLRVSNVASHLRALGMPEFSPPIPASSLLVAPVRHQGVGVGTIYLAHESDGEEFSQGDEETLVMFASQAALVIANARRHREVQQAKADLETLVNTSPVGVVVFAAGTGSLLSINREALRIVDGLRSPGQSPEQLLESVTFRRTDGREISLSEYPLTRVLSSGEKVRAEEIVIYVPDGRRVNTIINATPILSEEGNVESVVVTLQDLEPIRELGRHRAEFLSMVSQELLAPLTSIKGSAAAVLEDFAQLDIAKARQFFSIIEGQADRMRGLIWNLLEMARIEAGTLYLTLEPTDLAFLVGQAQASFLEGGAVNPIELDLPSELPDVAADRQRILQVLDRLLSNAARHSPEATAITVSARLEEAHVAVCVSYRGRDSSSQTSPMLFQRTSPVEGWSEDATGREALGMAVCRGVVEVHGGRLWLENDSPGMGARCLFTLPVAEKTQSRRTQPTGPFHAASRRSTPGRGRVLVVDDDPQMLWHIRNALTQEGYTISATWDQEEMERLIAVERPHLVLLAPAMTGADGWGLMQRISAMTDAPVVLLAGHGANRERDIALAFEAGADDYIARPFSPSELMARVGAALRRKENPGPKPQRGNFRLGELSIDYARRQVRVGDRLVALTETEYRLLCELAVNVGRTLGREYLMRQVWSTREPDSSGVVRAYVGRLRRKLGETADHPRYIFSEPRVGYRLGDAEEWGEPTT